MKFKSNKICHNVKCTRNKLPRSMLCRLHYLKRAWADMQSSLVYDDEEASTFDKLTPFSSVADLLKNDTIEDDE